MSQKTERIVLTRPCTGCYNSEDGHPVGEYEWDYKAGCFKGMGCPECGYTGKRRLVYKLPMEKS